MVKVSATRARNELFGLLKKSIRGHQQIIITTKEGDAVLMSEEDYESLLETLELLSTPGLLKSIKRTKREIERGETYSLDEVFGRK